MLTRASKHSWKSANPPGGTADSRRVLETKLRKADAEKGRRGDAGKNRRGEGETRGRGDVLREEWVLTKIEGDARLTVHPLASAEESRSPRQTSPCLRVSVSPRRPFG